MPIYQRQGKAAYKANLDNIELLAAHLGQPQDSFKSIHVAGTNGKGSTSHMLASVFQEAGYKVGLYTSPHLKDFRERIRINGAPISKQAVMGFVKKHKSFFEEHQLSFFEMSVGMAFSTFAKQKVDIAIVEVGLGGRLDATNIITPELSVITNIGLDHTQFLGDTLEKIAAEKAGIIKAGIPVVIGEYHEDTAVIFDAISQERNASLTKAYTFDSLPMQSDLKGIYQKHNIKTVQVAIAQLQNIGWAIGIQHVAKGLKNVVQNTGLLGRWQVLGHTPKIICDTGHNKEGLAYVVKQIQEEKFDRLHIVLGVIVDKDLKVILPLLPKRATYYFCRPDVPRGMDVQYLKKEAFSEDLKGKAYPTVKNALEKAKANAGIKDLIFVGGSTFVVAEII